MTSLLAAVFCALATYFYLGGNLSVPEFRLVKRFKFNFQKDKNLDQDYLEYLWLLKSELSSGTLLSNLSLSDETDLFRSRSKFLFDLNNQTGTSLTPTINRFIKQTKNQIELKQEIKSELASAKATVVVLAGLPVIGIFLSSLLGANSLNWLFTTSGGRACLFLGALLNLLGIIWIKKIINRSLVS